MSVKTLHKLNKSKIIAIVWVAISLSAAVMIGLVGIGMFETLDVAEKEHEKVFIYMIGQVNGGARLIKLQDTDGVAGLPDMLSRPDATANPIGADVATGWFVRLGDHRADLVFFGVEQRTQSRRSNISRAAKNNSHGIK